MGSIPTRSRHALLAALLGFSLGAPAAGAQQRDSARAGVAPARDSLVRAAVPAPPVSARRAFLYSLTLPGLGQSALDRPTAGALFFTVEAVALAMAGKSLHDLREARRLAGDSAPPVLRFRPDSLGRVARTPRTGQVQYDSSSNRYRGLPSLVAARRTHVEDWIALLLFNHLLSGADAFVAAQLWDLPTEVQLRILPRGARLGLVLRP